MFNVCACNRNFAKFNHVKCHTLTSVRARNRNAELVNFAHIFYLPFSLAARQIFGPRALLFCQSQIFQYVRHCRSPRRCCRWWRKLQSGSQAHYFANSQQRLMKIVLGYVTGPFVEFVFVSGSATYQKLSIHACRSGFKKKIMFLKFWIVLNISAYLYPEIAFKRLLFPAPDGPIIAESWPEANFPLTDFKMVLRSDLIVFPLKKNADSWQFIL